MVRMLHSAPALRNVSVCNFFCAIVGVFYVQFNCVITCIWPAFDVELVKMRFLKFLRVLCMVLCLI